MPTSSSSSSAVCLLGSATTIMPTSSSRASTTTSQKSVRALLVAVFLGALLLVGVSLSGEQQPHDGAAPFRPNNPLVQRLHEVADPPSKPPPPPPPSSSSSPTRGGLRRRLNNERSDCPADSLHHCDNPSLIMSDPDVACDMDTCEWDTSALRPDREPAPCRSIVITNVSALDDYLEPCLWWQMLYGDLATAEPGVSNETKAPAPAPSPTSSSSTSTTDWIDFDTILLTFLVDEAGLSGSSTHNSSSSSSSSSTTSNDKGSGGNRRQRRLRKRSRLRAARKDLEARHRHHRRHHRHLQLRMDAQVLLDVTTSHVLSELKRKLGEGDVADVSLVVTPVSTSSSRSSGSGSGSSSTTGTIQTSSGQQLVSLSQAVNGKVKFNKRIESQVDSPEVVQHLVDQAFEGDAMERFLTSLKGSSDPVMHEIQIVYKGLPSDLQGSVSAGDSSDSSSTDSLASTFEWNNWWIFIVAGAGAGLLACCLSASCVFYKCWTSPSRDRTKKLSKADDVDPTGSHDDTAPADDSDSPKAKGSGTRASPGVESPAEGQAIDGAEGEEDADAVDAAGGNNHFGDVSLDVSEMDNESYTGRYNPSDATSVYSYIDAHTMILADGDDLMEDQSSYSIAPSLMYDRIMPDDQSIQSRMWSVVDGLTYDGNLSLIEGKAPGTNEVAPGRVLVFGGGKSGKAGPGTTGGDDDDDLSLMSELHAPVGNVQKGNSELRVLQVVKKVEPTLAEAATTDPPPAVASKAALVSQPIPYTNMKSDDNDDAADEDEASSDSSYGPSTSDASQSPSTVTAAAALKKQLASKGVSVRVRKSKENLLSNRDVIAALGESSASDDDSSLFMGPADVGKGGNLLSLGATDKADPLATSTNGKKKKRDEFRFGPMRLGSKKLTKKEKEHLNLGGKGADPQGNNSEPSAFPIPRELMKPSEEKKDDMSVSSIGSSEATRAKALIDSVASF